MTTAESLSTTSAAFPLPTILDLCDLHEAAKITALSTRTLSAYVRQNRVPSLKVGHGRLFDRRALRAWSRDRRRQVTGSAGKVTPA